MNLNLYQAVEVTEETEEETNDDYGQGDYADAGDYFDCFEGAGIGKKSCDFF